jgi:sporulation protein YlmC with PRC-barrel domain
VHIVRDLLDKKVLDRNGREMGRVDGIVVEVGGSRPPRIAAIQIGLSVAAHRVRPFLGRWAAGLERALGIEEGRPLQIPFETIVDIGDHVRVDMTANHTPATTLERRLRRIVASIPGAS